MSLVKDKLDSKAVQDILSEVYEQSKSNHSLDAQEVVNTIVSRLHTLLQDEMNKN